MNRIEVYRDTVGQKVKSLLCKGVTQKIFFFFQIKYKKKDKKCTTYIKLNE